MSKKAFTFVELLVAILIFSIIVASIYSAFHVGLATYRKGEGAALFYQKLRLSLDALSLDLRNAYGFSQTQGRFSLDEGKLSFYSRKRLFSGRLSADFQLCRLIYWQQGSKLLRQVDAGKLAFSDEAQENPEILLDNLSTLKFEFPYQSGADKSIVWKDYWQQEDKLPLAVKISLEIADLQQKDVNISLVKMVYIPSGQLAQEKEE